MSAGCVTATATRATNPCTTRSAATTSTGATASITWCTTVRRQSCWGRPPRACERASALVDGGFGSAVRTCRACLGRPLGRLCFALPRMSPARRQRVCRRRTSVCRQPPPICPHPGRTRVSFAGSGCGACGTRRCPLGHFAQLDPRAIRSGSHGHGMDPLFSRRGGEAPPLTAAFCSASAPSCLACRGRRRGSKALRADGHEFAARCGLR